LPTLRDEDAFEAVEVPLLPSIGTELAAPHCPRRFRRDDHLLSDEVLLITV
jgi:hypothetical protein